MDNYSDQAQLEFSRRLAQFVEAYGSITERQEAILFAQSVELQLLKAPQTARFPSFENYNVSENDGHYKISGYVDSQNSYGASIRTPFTINAFKTGGSWSCSDKFVSTSSVVGGGQIVGHTILCWILGVIGTIITYFLIKSLY